jgi:glycosyltransferase involved in cell wall biosynthesis
MKIVLFSESSIIFHNGNYYSKDTWIKFPLYFSQLCDLFTIICTTKRISEINFEEYSKINIRKSKIIFISDYASFIEYYKKIIFHRNKWKRLIHNEVIKHDIVWLRTPSPISRLLFKSKVINSKKIVCFLAGDIKKQSDSLLESSGIKKIIYKFFINNHIKHEKKIYQKVDLLYYYSMDLFRRFEDVKTKKIPFRTPIISNSDIYSNIKKLDKKNIKIIRVCWLLPSKGLEHLIDSIKLLRNKKYNVKLSIIGSERDTNYKNELINYIDKSGLIDNVELLGWKSSKEISEYFKKYDIHVISSLSEGTPRVILESLSKSIPLVTTKVGGISSMLKNNHDCLMVDPGNSLQIASAVEKIINDEDLRESIIRNGIVNSKKWTLESKSRDIFEDMKAL